MAATRILAERLATNLRPGDRLRLDGDLGAGKTELARCIIQARTGEEVAVPSPTFTLMQSYAAPDLAIVHADLYRIAIAEEVEETGLLELADGGALLLEWWSMGEPLLPPPTLTVALALAEESEEARLVTIEAGNERWRRVLPELLP